VRVTSQNENWQESTESLDVSPLGVKLKLQRQAKEGMVLRIELPLPQPLRLQRGSEKMFGAVSIVCFVKPTDDEENIIGVEFGAIL
jgi:hypothetical protein